MTKRRLVWVGVVLCVALLTCAAAVRLTRPHPVNRANFERIRVGMTRAEVEAVLGYPPGDYAAGTVVPGSCRSDWVSYYGEETWTGDDGWLHVKFDEEGRVWRVSVVAGKLLSEPSFMDHLRAWLGW